MKVIDDGDNMRNSQCILFHSNEYSTTKTPVLTAAFATGERIVSFLFSRENEGWIPNTECKKVTVAFNNIMEEHQASSYTLKPQMIKFL